MYALKSSEYCMLKELIAAHETLCPSQSTIFDMRFLIRFDIYMASKIDGGDKPHPATQVIPVYT
jgi:hypothetical protein